jgi:hypothetical protein
LNQMIDLQPRTLVTALDRLEMRREDLASMRKGDSCELAITRTVAAMDDRSATPGWRKTCTWAMPVG